MIPTTMVFTHLLRVLSIINITDIDLNNVDSLKQSVDAFVAKTKAENQTSSTEQVDPNVTPLLLFFDFTKDLDDQVSQSDKNTLTNDEITQMYPDAITKLNHVKSATPKTSLKKKIWENVYSLRLYKDAIDNSKFVVEGNKQKIE